MPTRRTGQPTPCLGCGTVSQQSRCPQCAPTYNHTWTKLAKTHKQIQPTCQGPGPHKGRLETDHINPANLSQGIQTLCAACHHTKTTQQNARHQPTHTHGGRQP